MNGRFDGERAVRWARVLWFMAIAAVLAAPFFGLELVGARSDTGVISGTVPMTETRILSGMLYVLAWFSAVLLAPIFAIAGGLELGWGLWERISTRSGLHRPTDRGWLRALWTSKNESVSSSTSTT